MPPRPYSPPPPSLTSGDGRGASLQPPPRAVRPRGAQPAPLLCARQLPGRGGGGGTGDLCSTAPIGGPFMRALSSTVRDYKARRDMGYSDRLSYFSHSAFMSGRQLAARLLRHRTAHCMILMYARKDVRRHLTAHYMAALFLACVPRERACLREVGACRIPTNEAPACEKSRALGSALAPPLPLGCLMGGARSLMKSAPHHTAAPRPHALQRNASCAPIILLLLLYFHAPKGAGGVLSACPAGVLHRSLRWRPNAKGFMDVPD